MNLTIVRGDSLSLSLHFTQSGVDLDITGASVWFTMKTSVDDLDAAAIIQKKVTSHTDPTNGLTTISLTPAETILFTPGVYQFDIQYKSAAGTTILTPLIGQVEVKADVTRSTT